MLYWTDWKLDGVVKMSKFNTTITPVQLELYAPMDVKVWHPMKQIKGLRLFVLGGKNWQWQA